MSNQTANFQREKSFVARNEMWLRLKVPIKSDFMMHSSDSIHSNQYNAKSNPSLTATLSNRYPQVRASKFNFESYSGYKLSVRLNACITKILLLYLCALQNMRTFKTPRMSERKRGRICIHKISLFTLWFRNLNPIWL